MKKIKSSLIFAASIGLLALAPIALTGCGGAAAQSAEQIVVTSGAAAGTYAVLKNNPQYASDFAAGAAVLNQVAGNGGGLTSTNIQPVLAQLNQTNPAVGAVVESAVTVLDGYISNFETNSTAAATDFRTGCGWIAVGITEGIALSGQ